MKGFQFQDPLWLLLLAPLLLVAVLAVRRQRQSAMLFSDVGLLAGLPRTLASRFQRAVPWLRVLGMTLLVVAMARPRHGKEEFRIQTDGIAIEMCLDRSGSMQALDFQLDGQRVDRLTAVKKVFRDFVAGGGPLRGRRDDLVGLIDFGGFADSKCPLTLDHDALLEVLEAVEIPEPIFDAAGNTINQAILEEDLATAIGDAVVLAVERLKDARAKSKVIILLSDGKQTTGVIEPAEAAEAAALCGIRIHTIGVGSTGTAPVPEIDAFGRKVIRQNHVELDEDTLKMLAERTGGRYFHAVDVGMLESVYADIDRMERTPATGRRYTSYAELYPYAMVPGMVLILLEVLLVCTRFRTLP
jgi:Ca-activated chloride channel family protein